MENTLANYFTRVTIDLLNLGASQVDTLNILDTAVLKVEADYNNGQHHMDTAKRLYSVYIGQ